MEEFTPGFVILLIFVWFLSSRLQGLKSSLSSMDQEMPRGEGSISNRAQLAREVNIERLLKKNKVSLFLSLELY